jgi:ribosomal protein S18 acetylase RimI-like enzyme
MPENRALNKDIEKSKRSFMTEIVRMNEESVEAVKQIEIESGLSPWTVEDYKLEIRREDSIALISNNHEQINGFLVARLIMSGHGDVLFNGRGGRDEKNERGEKEVLEIEGANEAEIYNIAVKKQFQNCGIAQLLLDNFLSCAKKHKISKIWLEVRESNHPAIKFYLKNKFVKAGIRKSFYRAPVENALLMSLDL